MTIAIRNQDGTDRPLTSDEIAEFQALFGITPTPSTVPPSISTLPAINAAVAGALVSWSAGTATGVPAPTLTYALRKNGTVVATASGTYNSTVAGDVLTVDMTANNGVSPEATGTSASVIVSAAQAAPTITANAVLAPNVAGSPVTWTAAVAAGNPTPTIAYSLLKNGVPVATVSGAYSNTAAGDVLSLSVSASNGVGSPATSTAGPVTVSAATSAPTITAAPVLSPVVVGGTLSFTQGTVTGNPTPTRTYSLMRGTTVLAANITSGSAVPASVVNNDQVFIRLVASASGQASAQADSNVVTAALADPYMIASNRLQVPFNSAVVANTNIATWEYQADAITMASMPYDLPNPVFADVGFVVATGGVEFNLGNDFQILGRSIEIAGVRTRCTSGGQNGWTVSDGSTGVLTDPCPVTIPANTVYRVITARRVPVGSRAPIGFNQDLVANGTTLTDGRITSSTAWSDTTLDGIITGTTAFTGGADGAGYAPAVMLAKGWRGAGSPPVHLLLGASVGKGANDNLFLRSPGGVYGFLGRGLNNPTGGRRPFLNMCTLGANFASVSGSTSGVSNFAKRQAFLQLMSFPYTQVTSEMGGNDYNLVRSRAPAFFAYIKANLGGKKLVQTPILVHTPAISDNPSGLVDATLGFTTVANQRQESPTRADDVAFVREKSDPNMDDWFETSGYIDSGFDSFKFKTVEGSQWPTATTDLSTCTLAADAVQNATTFSVVALPADYAGLWGGGRYLGVYDPAVTTGTGPYTITCRMGNTGGTAMTAGTVLKEVVVATDGTHPNTRGAILASGAVVAAKQAGKA